MKLNISMMQLVIRLLILMILIVMLGIISTFLYSVKFWPDIYNYINANITIKRIPKISEIENLTIIEDTMSMTTDFYESTDFSTTEAYEDDYSKFEDFEDLNRRRRNVKVDEGKDYSEIPKSNVVVDYVFDSGENVDINDSIDESKLTTSDMTDVELIPGIFNNLGSFENIEENCTANTNISQLIFPWVATIFIKNDTSDQFDYYCDGAVVSKNVIITAARCLQYYETWTKSENIIVLLDKTSLRSMNGNEMAVKVKEVIIHDNFTMRPENDIAILVMETSLKRQTACFGEGDFGEAFTTGWAVSGELTLIPFDTEGIVNCNDFPVNNTFCASYKNDVSVCPSYGGLFVVRHTNTWYLRGIRSADPTDKGFCVDHDITFTDLTLYLDWIMQYIE
ncbi:unnamed protein product, partial [Brenthis ino]